MKKFATALLLAGIGLIAFAPAVSASKPGEGGITLPKGTHVKVDVCHWANGHPHIVPVSVSAVTNTQDIQHGDLTLTADLGLGSFVAHDTPGHAEDFVARIYTKHGNDETNTYVSDQTCGEETTTTTAPPTTTTTAPPVTTTTVPEVTTTTEAPVVTTTTEAPTTTTTAAPVVSGTTDTTAPPTVLGETQTAAQPVTTLPHTGTASLVLAGIGVLVGLTGLMMLLLSTMLKRLNANEAK